MNRRDHDKILRACMFKNFPSSHVGQILFNAITSNFLKKNTPTNNRFVEIYNTEFHLACHAKNNGNKSTR